MHPPYWFVNKVCVQLIKNSVPTVIKVANGRHALVELDDKSTQTVRCGDVSMMPPQEEDMVLVTAGAHVGLEAMLQCTDGDDVILKESNRSYHIIDSIRVAKKYQCMFIELLMMPIIASLWKRPRMSFCRCCSRRRRRCPSYKQ
jgi:hypothetical protein